MKAMLTFDQARAELFALLKRKSVFRGQFKLSSGGTSNYYIDCRLTTLDARGAWLVGQVVHDAIRKQAAATATRINAVGGLTMGADPIALAAGMFSVLNHDAEPLRVFTVRKAQKVHGQGKLIEGNFQAGDSVAVVDDVVTRGDSTIAAINAVNQAGGQVAFVVVLVDRQEGGRAKIEELGYTVFPVFQRDELL